MTRQGDRFAPGSRSAQVAEIAAAGKFSVDTCKILVRKIVFFGSVRM
jgi:hypothetical protein